MEKEILSVIHDKIAITIQSPIAAKEIDDLTRNHYMKFVLWLSQNTEHTPYSDIYYIIGSGFNKMSLDELYKYWLKNR